MTNTETFTSAKLRRARWLRSLALQLSENRNSVPRQVLVLHRILDEGPELARPDCQWWDINLRWFRLQVEREAELLPTLLQGISRMRRTNDRSGR